MNVLLLWNWWPKTGFGHSGRGEASLMFPSFARRFQFLVAFFLYYLIAGLTERPTS